MSDVELRISGMLVALLSVLAASAQQIGVAFLQKQHALSSSQLLSQVAPYQVCYL